MFEKIWDKIRRFFFDCDEYQAVDSIESVVHITEEQRAVSENARNFSESKKFSNTGVVVVSTTGFTDETSDKASGDRSYKIKYNIDSMVKDIRDGLLANKCVIVNLSNIDQRKQRRIVDYVSGMVFMIDGYSGVLDKPIYVFAPKHISVKKLDDSSSREYTEDRYSVDFDTVGDPREQNSNYRGTRSSISSRYRSSNNLEVIIISSSNTDVMVEDIRRSFLEDKCVIADLLNIDAHQQWRIIDFIYGMTSIKESHNIVLKKSIYFFAPKNVDVKILEDGQIKPIKNATLERTESGETVQHYQANSEYSNNEYSRDY